jgi:hypothetical protein
MDCPFLGTVDKGIAGVRKAIIFNQSLDWDEALAEAARLASRLKLRVKDRFEGPTGEFMWFVTDGKSNFILGYHDFPCELYLCVDPPVHGPANDTAVEQLFSSLRPGD